MENIYKYRGVHGDAKAKLTAKDPSIFSGGLLAALAPANGVIFPYSPDIQVGHAANYGSYDMPHTNYQTNFYQNSPNSTIGIQATFTAQDVQDAIISAASLQFFKSMTKMDFGKSSRAAGTAGAPPPVLLFSAYGALSFKNTPVILRNFSYALGSDADMVTFEEKTIGQFTVPTLWMAQLDLVVQIAPTTQKEFNINSYRDGSLLKGGGWA